MVSPDDHDVPARDLGLLGRRAMNDEPASSRYAGRRSARSQVTAVRSGRQAGFLGQAGQIVGQVSRAGQRARAELQVDMSGGQVGAGSGRRQSPGESRPPARPGVTARPNGVAVPFAVARPTRRRTEPPAPNITSTTGLPLYRAAPSKRRFLARVELVRPPGRGLRASSPPTHVRARRTARYPKPRQRCRPFGQFRATSARAGADAGSDPPTAPGRPHRHRPPPTRAEPTPTVHREWAGPSNQNNQNRFGREIPRPLVRPQRPTLTIMGAGNHLARAEPGRHHPRNGLGAVCRRCTPPPAPRSPRLLPVQGHGESDLAAPLRRPTTPVRRLARLPTRPRASVRLQSASRSRISRTPLDLVERASGDCFAFASSRPAQGGRAVGRRPSLARLANSRPRPSTGISIRYAIACPSRLVSYRGPSPSSKRAGHRSPRTCRTGHEDTEVPSFELVVRFIPDAFPSVAPRPLRRILRRKQLLRRPPVIRSGRLAESPRRRYLRRTFQGRKAGQG